MNEPEAKQAARKYLCDHIKLDLCTDFSGVSYELKPENEFIYQFKLFGSASIGSSEYIAISKATGSVRYLGCLDE